MRGLIPTPHLPRDDVGVVPYNNMGNKRLSLWERPKVTERANYRH